MIRIDATNLILGRMSTRIAKALMKGEEVIIVNAEKAVITGNPPSVIREYQEKRNRGKIIHGPFFPKMPDRLVKRTIRGMLPHQKADSRDALKRLTVYIGVPKDMANEKFASIKDAQLAGVAMFITLEDLTRELGYVPR